MPTPTCTPAPSRRHFLTTTSLALLPAFSPTLLMSQTHAHRVAASLPSQPDTTANLTDDTPIALRFAVMTDIHYADADPRKTRYYRDSLPKVNQAIRELNDQITHAPRDTAPSLCLMLGDLIDSRKTPIDQGGVEEELAYLDTIEAAMAKLNTPRHYVFGNHCVYTLTKDEFAAHTVAQPTYYSFDHPLANTKGHLHMVILDACFTSNSEPYGRRNFTWSDANIPQHELDWLKADLKATPNPTIIFTHQRLDAMGGLLTINNATQVREIINNAKNVIAVFQGHSHENSLVHHNNIPYLVFRAIVEGPGLQNNAYATVDIFPDLSILIHGHYKQLRQKLPVDQ